MQTCFSLVIAASTMPLRHRSRVSARRVVISSSTARYSVACSAVRLHRCLTGRFSGRSAITAGSDLDPAQQERPGGLPQPAAAFSSA